MSAGNAFTEFIRTTGYNDSNYLQRLESYPMPEEKQQPEWYTTKKASEEMGITKEAVQRLCRDGRITCEKWGRDWMIHRDSVKSYEITTGGRGKKAGDN